MIESIKCIKNLGPFKSIEKVPLAKKTLIFAENGRGKTMLSEMFRSLATNQPDLVAGRKRLGADGGELLIVLCQSDGGNVLRWGSDSWTGGKPKMAVFNDGFVEANVYSGLEVTAAHRQGLHSVVVGEEGVRLAKAYLEAQERAENAQKDRTKASDRIKVAVPGVDDVDRFCDEPVPLDIDAQIEENKRQRVLAKKASEIENRAELSQLDPPKLHDDELRVLLRSGIPQVTGEAVNRVKAHLDHLWERGEAWVNDGWMHAGRDGDCPYCGQPLSRSTLVNDFAEYFEDAYASFKERIATFRTRFIADNSEDQRRSYEKQAKRLAELCEGWARGGLEMESGPQFKSSDIIESWQSFAAGSARALTQKAAAPFEIVDLDDETENALHRLNRALAAAASENQLIPDLNAKILELKQSVDRLDLAELETEEVRLRCLKQRNTEEVAPACRKYLDARNVRDDAKVKSDQLNRELTEYRKSIFQEYGDAVNQYLCDFGTGFKLAKLVGTSRRGGGSSQYEISINGHGVEVASQSPPEGGPSFKNTLSGGDRTSLALAFFFASLERRKDIKETIVVIDDPMSSLDDARRQHTMDCASKLADSTGQLIVMSHDRDFLCKLSVNTPKSVSWQPRKLVSKRVAPGVFETEFTDWDIAQARLSVAESRVLRMSRYLKSGYGDTLAIAADIRQLLESFICLTFPDEVERPEVVGKFIGKCSSPAGQRGELISSVSLRELKALNKYSQTYHHAGAEPPNEVELRAYVERTLRLCRW